MKYEAFTDELKAAGISGHAFARMLKLNPNSIANYKSTGAVPSHLGVIAALIRAMNDAGLDYESVIAQVPIERKAARGSPSGLRSI